MATIITIDKEVYENNNRILGKPELFLNSSVVFSGKNNTLFFSQSVKLTHSTIKFQGDNALVFLSGSRESYSVTVMTYNQSVVFIGEDLATNEPLRIICSEAKHVFLGNDCLISSCLIRTGDAHRLYDIRSGMRINEGKSVYFGDHIWIGASVTVLKGSRLHSGCIIGSNALLTGKEYYSSTVYGGNPAKAVRKNTAYDKKGSHGLTPATCAIIAHLSEENLLPLVYDKNEDYISFDMLESFFNTELNAEKRIAFLLDFQKEPAHNRFSNNAN